MIPITSTNKTALRDSADPVFYVVLFNVSGDPWPDSKVAHLFSQRPVDHSSTPSNYEYYEDRMTQKSIGVIKSSFDHRKRGGVAQTGTLSFAISNHGNFFEGQEDLDIFYSGCEVALYLNYKNTTIGQDLLMWYGVVREVERLVVADEVKFTCEDLGVTFDKPVPPNSYNSDDGDPLGTRGKPIPIVFGEHEIAVGVRESSITNPVGVNDSFGPRYLFTDVGVGPLYQISNAVFGDSGLIDATGGIADIDTAVSAYTLDDATGSLSFNDVSPESLGLIIDFSMDGRLAVKGGAHAPAYGADDSQWLHVTDGISWTYAQMLVTWFGDNEMFYVKFPEISTDGNVTMISGGVPKIFVGYRAATYWATTRVTIHSLVLGNHRDLSIGGGVPGYGLYEHRIPLGPDPVWYYPTPTTATDETIYFDEVPSTPWISGGLSTLGNAFIGFGLQSTGSQLQLRAYELYDVRIYATVEFPSDSGIYANVKGCGDVSGAYTGTPGTLIENPSDMAHFFVDKLMGSSGLVDTSSFSDLRDLFSGWKFARQLVKRDDAYDVLDGLAADAGIWITINYAGLIGATTVIGENVDDFILSPSDVIDGVISSAKQTDIADVRTDFLFRYKWNPIMDDYQETLHCNWLSSSDSIGTVYEDLCIDARKKYTASRDIYGEFDLPWVRDETTAVLVAKQIISSLTSRRWMLEFEADVAMSYVEPGDRFTMAAGLWPDLPSDLASKQYAVTSVATNPTKYRMKIKAVEV